MKLAIVIIALIGATLASPQDAPQPASERQDKPQPAAERTAYGRGGRAERIRKENRLRNRSASPQDAPQPASERQDKPQQASERQNDSE